MAERITLRDRDFVCTVRGDVITDWKRLLARFSRSSAPHFVFGSDSSKFRAYAQPRSTLWVVLLRESDHPVLIARMKIIYQHRRDQPLNIRDPELASLVEHFHRVERNAKQGWEYVAVGSRSRSRFFPFNDASDAAIATALKYRTSLKRPSKPPRTCKLPQKWERKFAIQMQGSVLMQVLQKEANPWWKLEQGMKGHEVFISYLHAAHDQADPLIEDLQKEGVPIWFDRFALPVARATEKLDDDDSTLRWVLDQGLTTSDYVVGVATAGYAPHPLNSKQEGKDREPPESWTRHEWRHAKQRILYVPPGGEDTLARLERDTEHPFERLKAGDSAGAANEIRGLTVHPDSNQAIEGNTNDESSREGYEAC